MNPYKVATQAFNALSMEEQERILDAMQYRQVNLTQEQIDVQVERYAATRRAEEHFRKMREKWNLHVPEKE
jgi:hypothetical protein